MIMIQPKKKDSNLLIIERPKERGHMPPPSRKFKNKKHLFKNKWHQD